MSTPLIIWSSENYKKSSPMPEHSLIDGKTKQFKVCRNFSDKLAAREFNLNINNLVAQEADTKIRSHRAEVQNLRLDNNELRHDLKELVEKNSDFARQVSESDRDRAQLNARVITLQQKLKPFLAKQ